MESLAQKIASGLKRAKATAIYDSELARLWPPSMNPEQRKREIANFAKKHRFDVTFFDVGLCAVFEKPPKSERKRAS